MPPLMPFRPFWQTTDKTTVKLYCGHVTTVLARLPEKSVHCTVTSPPYWGLRSYLANDHADKVYEIGAEPSPDCKTDGQAQCGKCFVCSMVAVFRGVRRVLRDDGCAFLNLGDTYGGGGTRNGKSGSTLASAKSTSIRSDAAGGTLDSGDTGLKSGNLIGIPWRVALALQEDGWVLRSDMPWVKLSPMPESVMNRPCKALEYFFMFTKGMTYYFDVQAVKVKSLSSYRSSDFIPKSIKDAASPSVTAATHASRSNGSTDVISDGGRNFRNADLFYESLKAPHGVIVAEGEGPIALDVTSQGYEGAHFAVFPGKLVTPLIKAATSEKGCCAKCGAPWKRVTGRTGGQEGVGREDLGVKVDRSFSSQRNGLGGSGSTIDGVIAVRKTLGWEPPCLCGEDEGSVIPCTVLDPFIGSGTVGEVALGLGLHVVGIDLSEKYLLNNAVTRISGVLGRYRQSHLIPKT